jgi:hypothetical protein
MMQDRPISGYTRVVKKLNPQAKTAIGKKKLW